MTQTAFARSGDVDVSMVVHQLCLFGMRRKNQTTIDGVLIFDNPETEEVEIVRRAAKAGHTIVVLSPSHEFCAQFGVRKFEGYAQENKRSTQEMFPLDRFRGKNGAFAKLWTGGFQLRTLHPFASFHGCGEAVIETSDHNASWWIKICSPGHILFIGTDLAGDIIRYRQGDPRKAEEGVSGDMWGLPGERPNYLFQEQRDGEVKDVRHADEWAYFLTQLLANLRGMKLIPILPGNARGAIVFTGDSDAVTTDAVYEQLHVLNGLPMTYFLHPKVDHSQDLIAKLKQRQEIELAIHPDALDAPSQYDPTLESQMKWFEQLVGHTPTSVRNHGFLNRGYWGHLHAWIASGLVASSNLPGLDGDVLNGSLLPARIAFDEKLTSHWSILTLIGDGAIFVNNLSDTAAENCVLAAAQRVIGRNVPGVIVLNLHPINIRRALPMHRAAIEVVKNGFLAWNMRECIDWFSSKDCSYS